MAPQLRCTSIKHIQLIRIDYATVLAVIVTDAGIVKNSVLRLMEDVNPTELERITNMLNSTFAGLYIEEIESIDIENILKNSLGHGEIVEQILPELVQTLVYSDNVEIYHDGAANILNLPEYSDIKKARNFLNTLEEKELLFKALNEVKEDIDISIGKENKIDQFKDCSLITASYKINGKTIGSIGVVGPTRMEYTKVISIVECMTNNLNEILTKILKR
jgi:heat-inducible transcriptional repressor